MILTTCIVHACKRILWFLSAYLITTSCCVLRIFTLSTEPQGGTSGGQDINHLAATARTRQHDSARADRGHGDTVKDFPAVWYQDKQSTERSTSTCTAPCTCVCQALCFGMVWPGKASCWHQDTTPPVTPGHRTLLLVTNVSPLQQHVTRTPYWRQHEDNIA